jgi:hypothetical protein
MQHELQAKIVDILERCMDMTVATVMADGAPHATVVSFAHDGLTLYFGCGASSHKAANIARDPRVALTVTPPYAGWDAIQGLSIEAEAHEVTAPAELVEGQALMLRRFPQLAAFEVPEPGTIKVFRLRPTLVAVLDYSKGFGHTDVVRVGDDDIAESLESMAHHWLMVPAPV